MNHGRSHLLECQNPDCDYVTIVAAGDLPTRCQACNQRGFWMVSQVYIWDLKDLKVLRALGISPA